MALERLFLAKSDWPPKPHRGRLHRISKYNALFEGDEEIIKAWVKEIRRSDEEPLREFVAYPAPEIAARILATFLFGEDALVRSNEAQDAIDSLIEENHLHSVNQEAAVTCAVEGEVFYKLDWDEDLADESIISVVSGGMAFPRFRFGRLVEIVFVAELERDDDSTSAAVTRHVEHREPGKITHKLFKGSDSSLGDELDLDAHPETEDYAPFVNDEGELETDIDDLLVRHVPFWRTSASPHGISIFRAKEGLIQGIHTLYTQDQHDSEMSKRRLGIPSNYLKRDKDGRPVFDRTLDIFELTEEAAGAIGAENKPIHPIEFTDSTVMGQRIAQRIDEFLLACGIAPQSAGRDVAGAAESGTARRLAQSLTLQTVATAGRYFAPALRDVVTAGLGIGKKHLKRAVPEKFEIQVEMQDGMVNDEKELATIVNVLSQAGAISLETKVRMLHPTWTDTQVNEEIERIKEEDGLKLPEEFRTPPSEEDEETEEEIEEEEGA